VDNTTETTESKIERYKKKSMANVIVWTGARGSGKTLSAVFECALHLMRGEKVWSNVPIAFWCDLEDGTEPFYCSTIPLDMNALYTFDKDLVEGTVFVDEVQLWSNSQLSTAVATRLLSSILTLIRKRSLNFFFTTQNYDWMPRTIRFQCDIWISVIDLSFKYHNLSRGTCIGQTLRDMSGMYTGTAYGEEDNYYSVRRTFYGEKFWGIYDTFNEFNPLEAGQKIKIHQEAKHLYMDEAGGAFVSDGKMLEDTDRAAVEAAREYMSTSGLTFIDSQTFQSILYQVGSRSNLRHLGKILPEYGFKYKHGRKSGESGYTLEE